MADADEGREPRSVDHEDISADGENASSSEVVTRSSRTMPVPEFLSRSSTHRSPDNIGVPPPDCDAVMTYENKLEAASSQNPAVRDQDDMQNETEDDGNTALTPEEMQVIMQMRGARGDYLGNNSRCNSYEEAIEMEEHTKQIEKSPDERRDAAGGFTDLQTIDFNGQGRKNFGGAVADEESGRADTRDESSDIKCTSCGPLNGVVTSFRRFLAHQPRKKVALYCLLVTGILGVLLFLSIFPASFVYVDYHEIALKQNKITNVVDTDAVYYGGCYVLGPSTKFIYFDASTHDFVREFGVFTKDTISVTITFSMHYFVRPRELGKLFRLFHMDYDGVVQDIAVSVLRNLAGETLTVDNFRFDRTYVETVMHAALRDKLGGSCCPDCCMSRNCQSNAYCGTCSSSPSCTQGYHIDVRYFNLLAVKIPNEVFEKYLQATILKVQTEREDFIQEHAVTVKETEQQTKNITNLAMELVQAGQAEAKKISMIADAQMERTKQLGLLQALNEMYTRLNVTRQDRKLSLMMIRELEANVDNLFSGYGYDRHSLYTGP